MVVQPESLALLKSSIYYTAPVTHRTIPRVTKADWVRSALDPHDRTAHPPKQSVSEQQQTQNPIHGLSMWDALVRCAHSPSLVWRGTDYHAVTSCGRARQRSSMANSTQSMQPKRRATSRRRQRRAHTLHRLRVLHPRFPERDAFTRRYG